ncbi:MAG TPA: response regulator [Alphaproteobacteria bacterium]|jgi:CheY-like chemotaxis protein|nr:response regulator [Alphaproteobacteria bacterium]
MPDNTSKPQPNAEPFVILIGEDQETDGFFLQEAAKRLETLTSLHIVTSGQAVLDFLKQRGAYVSAPKPDMLLLDINMPGKNGHETLSEIKSDPEIMHLPVVMLSGSDADRDLFSSYEYHANAYVVKPGDFNDMLLLMQALETFWFKTAVLPRK